MRWFSDLSLLKKILFISVFMMLCALAWGGFNSYLGYMLMKEHTMKKNQALVETMITTMEGLESDAKNGEISIDDAQETAKTIIGHSRYEGDQYFFVTSLDGQAIVHPIRPEYVGQDLSSYAPESYKRYLEFAKIAKANKDGGEAYYHWSKPGLPKEQRYPKSSFIKLMPEWGWVVGTGVYIDDLQKEAFKTFYLELIFVSIFGVALIIGTYGAVKILSRPLQTLSNNMGELAGGNLDVDTPYEHRKDEVGLIAKAFKVFKENAIQKHELEQKQEATKRLAEKEKHDLMQNLANDFEKDVSGVLSNLTKASQEMYEKATMMAQDSEHNIKTSELVASAATVANGNVQTVAAASEELTASSLEISRQIASVAEKSSRASQEAEQTNDKVSELNRLADSIGEVVGAIKDIAEQTNLLALNATIEAARAGEAGKGFAVVAEEVKKLATETASKTEEIDTRVARIQEAIRGSSDSMLRIIRDVQNIDSATTSVAKSIEEQNSATAAIGFNVAEASHGTTTVFENIIQVKQNTETTSVAANDVKFASQNVGSMTANLEKAVQSFLKTLRGA